MEKAYDRIECGFLTSILSKFGFSPHFIRLVNSILHAQRFSLMVNSSLKGYFPNSRWLRQRDLLSPRLLIVAHEMLSRGLSLLMDNHVEFRFYVPGDCPYIFHIISWMTLPLLFFVIALGTSLKPFSCHCWLWVFWSKS